MHRENKYILHSGDDQPIAVQWKFIRRCKTLCDVANLENQDDQVIPLPSFSGKVISRFVKLVEPTLDDDKLWSDFESNPTMVVDITREVEFFNDRLDVKGGYFLISEQMKLANYLNCELFHRKCADCFSRLVSYALIASPKIGTLEDPLTVALNLARQYNHLHPAATETIPVVVINETVAIKKRSRPFDETLTVLKRLTSHLEKIK
jgi:hypothetical protein